MKINLDIKDIVRRKIRSFRKEIDELKRKRINYLQSRSRSIVRYIIEADNRKKAILSLIVVAFVVLPSITIVEMEPKKKLYLDFDNNMAYYDLQKITSVGPNRLTGTDNELKAAEYIEEQFANAGLQDVTIEEYPVTCYEVDKAQVSFVKYINNSKINYPDPRYNPVMLTHLSDFVVNSYSGSTTWTSNDDDLPVVFLNSPDDINSNVAGKAVALKSSTISSLTDAYMKVGEYGGKMIIEINDKYHPENDYMPISKGFIKKLDNGHMAPFPDTADYSKADYASIPGIMVSKSIGEKMLSENYRIRATIHVTIEKRPVRIVSGEVKGKTDDFVIVGAHHDSVYAGVGAMDDGSGTVGVIGLAREMAKYVPPVTVKFVTFGGEEEGLLGSWEYYKAHKQDIDSHMVCMLNLDQTQVNLERADSFSIISTDEKMKNDFDTIIKELSADERYQSYSIKSVYDPSVYGVDMNSFSVEGKIGATAVGGGSYEYHTKYDTIDHIGAQSLGIIPVIYGMYIMMYL